MSLPGEECRACGAAVFDIDVRCGSCGSALTSTGAQRMIGSVVLEHYEVTDILGQGGMSVVYRGKHKITDQEVALKVLPPELAAYRDVKGRFLEEGRALAQLDHPNIVHLYNFGDDGDCLVLAMQLVRGATWERMIMEQDRLPWRRSAELTRDVSNALDYAHGRGIIHRDMKPSNVLVRDLDGAATVMDFGIAKMQSSSKLTATGQTMGTVRYMSPEQVRGLSVGVETDIYSLAMTTYESLVGDTPFTGDTHFEIMTKHLSEQPVPPSKRGIDIPPAFEAILMRAISKAPSDRQSSALEFKEQLQAVLDGNAPEKVQPTTAKTLSLGAQPAGPGSPAASPPDEETFAERFVDLPTGKKRRRGIGILAMGAVVVVAGAATFVLTQSPKPAAEPGEVTLPQTTKPAPETPVEALAGGFRLAGLDFAVDQTFPEDRLRVLATGEISADRVRKHVLEARSGYEILSKEEGWPEDGIPMPLTVALVPQSVFCNPNLYEGGRVAPNCQLQDGWYRPKERSLYLVENPDGEVHHLLRWITTVRCIHGKVPPSCAEVIQKRFGK